MSDLAVVAKLVILLVLAVGGIWWVSGRTM
jgi:hypothetical protein